MSKEFRFILFHGFFFGLIAGFGGWHMGNQSQDEVFLAAQEAVGAHRDSQGKIYDSIITTFPRIRTNMGRVFLSRFH